MGQAMAVFYSRSLKSFEGVESSLETAWETRVPIRPVDELFLSLRALNDLASEQLDPKQA